MFESNPIVICQPLFNTRILFNPSLQIDEEGEEEDRALIIWEADNCLILTIFFVKVLMY